jgi:hypothetical protein
VVPHQAQVPVAQPPAPPTQQTVTVPPLPVSPAAPQAPQPEPVSATSTPAPTQAAGPDLLTLQHENAALLAENKRIKDAAEAVRAAEETQRLESLPKTDRLLAELEIIKRQSQEATQRAHEWRIAAELKDIVSSYGGEIDETSLDTSSLESLRASIPQAVQSYQATESRMFAKFRQQLNMQNQAALEGLPPSPSSVDMSGFPSANNAGAVPSLPAGVNPAQPMSHPQVSRDNLYPGRVFQTQGMPQNPQPNAQGGYLPPQPYVQQGQYAPYVQQPQVMNAPVAPHNPASVQAAAPPPAPTPDPNMSAQGVPGRPLSPGEANSAVEMARASIVASRRSGTSGLAALGHAESHSNASALAMHGGQQPISHQSLPVPTGGSQRQHPQYIAGARV